jgi:glycerol uptake facilitator-like aquaporin
MMPIRPLPVFAPYLAEALGTFALVFAGPGAIAVDAESGAASAVSAWAWPSG